MAQLAWTLWLFQVFSRPEGDWVNNDRFHRRNKFKVESIRESGCFIHLHVSAAYLLFHKSMCWSYLLLWIKQMKVLEARQYTHRKVYSRYDRNTSDSSSHFSTFGVMVWTASLRFCSPLIVWCVFSSMSHAKRLTYRAMDIHRNWRSLGMTNFFSKRHFQENIFLKRIRIDKKITGQFIELCRLVWLHKSVWQQWR